MRTCDWVTVNVMAGKWRDKEKWKKKLKKRKR